MPFVLECFWAFQMKATFYAIFKKIPMVAPLHFFRKCGFGWPGKNCHNLAIRARLEPPYARKSCQVLALLVHTNYRIMPSPPECFMLFKRELLFGRFLKNFPLSPLCTFSENAGFGWPCENCHNLIIRALLEPPFAPNSFLVFAL